MELAQLMAQLESLGSPQTVKTYRRHGADGEMFGVKIADLKKLLKLIRGNQALALELWETGNSDAMYLASLAADGQRMTRKQLDAWAKSAWWYLLSEYAVPFVAAEHPDAMPIGRRWMEAKKPAVVTSGWCTIAAAISVRADAELDLGELEELLHQVETGVHQAPGRVGYCMNSFVISVGSYVKPLFPQAVAVSKKIGKLQIDLGETSCKVPVASDVLRQVEALGRVGKKRKSAKC